MHEPPSDLPETMQHSLRMWNELDLEKVREFRTKFPTAELDLASRVDHHRERYRDEWVITMDGKVLMPGFDVVTLGTSGLLERVDGFFGVLERTD